MLVSELYDIGVDGVALKFLESYLTDRTVQVTVDCATTQPLPMPQSVPQRSVLGPTLFNIYTRSIAQLLDGLNVSYHIFADDIQIYFSFDPNKIGELKCRIKTSSNNY